jgi:hypothetical protein
LGKFFAQDEDTVLARQGCILSQMTGEVNIAEHFTLLAGVASVCMYVCMYVCTLQQAAVVEGKGVCLLRAVFFFLTQKRQILIG